MADLVQIKLEPKSEPEDEVDTIEYELPLNQLDETFSVKVEKIDPDGDRDEKDAPSAYINRFGELVDSEQLCTSHIGKHSNETSKVTMSHQGTAAKSNKKSTKLIGKTRNERLAQKTQHKCKDCGYVTTDSGNLKKHMYKHTGERPFPCDSCDKRFIRKERLKRHMKVHASKDSVYCPSCWNVFATKEEQLVHELTCKWRRYNCFLCQAFLNSDIVQLKRHMRIHSGVRPFQCTQCSMKFTQKQHLENHMKTHSRQPKPRCSVCARNFLKESEKDAHEMNCNRRRYECYLCQNYMACEKSQLQYHMRMRHSGERPFKCDSCVKLYAMEYELTRHVKKSHKQ